MLSYICDRLPKPYAAVLLYAKLKFVTGYQPTRTSSQAKALYIYRSCRDPTWAPDCLECLAIAMEAGLSHSVPESAEDELLDLLTCHRNETSSQ